MFLGTEELLRLVKEKQLVENLCERELKNPEGTGFDLRLGKIFKIKGEKALLGEKERFTPEVEEISKFTENENNFYEFKPGEYVLMETVEKVNLPNDIAAIFRPRSTLFRSGIALYTATASPGYKGTLTFGMVNHGSAVVKIEMGARVVHILFLPVKGDIVSGYRGQWQGGRVSTDGEKETQI